MDEQPSDMIPAGLRGEWLVERKTRIVSKYVGPHACPLPGRRERKRRGIHLGDIIECEGCHQRWEWKDIGWEDSQKVWWRV